MNVAHTVTDTYGACGVHTPQGLKSLDPDILVVPSKPSTSPQAISQTLTSEVTPGTW